MPALLLSLAFLLLQDPPVDDISKAYPDPVPADRAWDMAGDYFRKIGGHLSAGEYDLAREWDRRARARLPDPYRQRLAQRGAQFWMMLRGYPGNRVEVEEKAAFFIISLTGGSEREIAALRRSFGTHVEAKREAYFYDLAIVMTRIGEGQYDRALRLLNGVERVYTDEFVPKHLDEYRESIKAMRASPDAASALARAASACSGTDRSWGPSLALLDLVQRRLKAGPDADERKALVATMTRLLGALGDAAGVKAFEDRVVGDRDTEAGESRAILQRRLSEALRAEDHKQAEALCRTILRRWPSDPGYVGVLFQLGTVLKAQGKFAEARTVFGQVARTPDAPERKPRGPDHGPSDPTQALAEFEIGGCFEGEEKWDKALEVYRSLPTLYLPGRREYLPQFLLPEAILRCRMKLRQFGEALAEARGHVLEAGPCSPQIAIGFVELAITQDRLAEEERRIKADGAVNADGVEMVLAHLEVLRLRSARDAAGLFALVKDGDLPLNLHTVRRWEIMRWTRQWKAIETLECLGELGDDAVAFLEPIARLGIDRAHVALVALARVRNERSTALLKEKLDWVSGHLGHSYGQTYRRLAEDPPRERVRLPEKPAAPPDPKAVERLREAADKIRARLPELTAKLKVVADLLAKNTPEGRFQALGETILAWKKGLIVDEDFADLVTLALDEKWELPPKPLLALVRENRAAPAAALVAPLVRSDDADLRAGATQLMSSFKHRESLPDIVILLKDPNGEVFSAAISAVVGFRAKEQIPTIVEFLKNPGRDGRARLAIWALGQLDAQEHVETIAAFLDHTDSSLISAAIDSLAKLGAKKHLEKIRTLLKHKEEWVRRSAQDAVKRLEK